MSPFRFLKDRRGGVTPMFALAIVPVVGFVGASIDYSRANSIKAGMQSALDATSLAMAKLAPTLTPAELQTKTTAYFNAMFSHADAKNMTVTPTYTTAGGSQLTISAAASMDTAFMKLMGYSNLDIKSSSTVKWGNNRLRVALALDNTGSMNDDGKMGALKTATKNLLDQLKAAATTNGDVYVSIIPFSKDVNIGTTNRNASWLDWTAWDAANGSCSNWHYDTKSECENAGKTWTAENHNNWNGCVVDRGRSTGPSSNNYDTNVTAPGSSNSSKFSPEKYSDCTQEVMALSYNWTQMSSLVNNMTPNGNTNQNIGLAHAWMSLVGGGPYPTPPAKDANYQYNEVIILLTDGLNTQNRWYSDQASIDARQALTCANAKAAGMTIYAIQVNTSGDPTQNVLKNCASSSSNFFTVTSSGQINTVFSQIGTQLSKLRISK
jgi:Flp pilus assembly protein TadG